MQAADIARVAYEMTRLLEDRLRMSWEDDRACLLREVRGLRGAAARQQRVIDRIQREFDAVKQLVAARQQGKGRPLQRDGLSSDSKGQDSSRDVGPVHVGTKRPRLMPSASGDAVERASEAWNHSRADRVAGSPASSTGREASAARAARALPDSMLFAEEGASPREEAPLTGPGPSHPPRSSPPKSVSAGGVIEHDVQMSPTIAMGAPGEALGDDETKSVSVLTSRGIPAAPASEASTAAVMSNQMEASRQIISKGLSTRRRDVRAMLPGHTCVECEKYINVLLQQGIIQTEEERMVMLQTCSRHKSVVPPPASTPEGFWDLTVHTPEEWNI